MPEKKNPRLGIPWNESSILRCGICGAIFNNQDGCPVCALKDQMEDAVTTSMAATEMREPAPGADPEGRVRLDGEKPKDTGNLDALNKDKEAGKDS